MSRFDFGAHGGNQTGQHEQRVAGQEEPDHQAGLREHDGEQAEHPERLEQVLGVDGTGRQHGREHRARLRGPGWFHSVQPRPDRPSAAVNRHSARGNRDTLPFHVEQRRREGDRLDVEVEVADARPCPSGGNPSGSDGLRRRARRSCRRDRRRRPARSRSRCPGRRCGCRSRGTGCRRRGARGPAPAELPPVAHAPRVVALAVAVERRSPRRRRGSRRARGTGSRTGSCAP